MTVRPLAAATAVVVPLALLAPPTTAQPVTGQPVTAERAVKAPAKKATARGFGGAVSSVDPYASRIGLKVLRRGGNAVDAAVATAAALGVTEPYSAGIGGGGYFVYYDAKSKRVRTIDGRETAPTRMPHDAFIDPATGQPYRFSPELVTSGVSVGVPGTPATWQRALRRWGSLDLGRVIEPAAKLAARGFVVDPTFRLQTLENKVRFDAFTSTRALFLPGGDAPAVGSVLKNPDLARTYRLLGRKGVEAFYSGRLARQIARTAQRPPKTDTTTLPVPPGYLTAQDLRRYRVKVQRPTKVRYRGYDVYGMAPSSSGGSTVGESLNILKRYNLAGMPTTSALHHYLESTALAFADRGRYVGDPAFVAVPLKQLLSEGFAAERACQLDPAEAATKPVPAGTPDGSYGPCPPAAPRASATATKPGSTTNLTVSDRWGNVVEYTLTIEQTGGSGIVVPRRGFILNNELTDFSAVWNADDPNRIEPGKRPRSSMSPTIVLRKGKPFVALGSPGGSTIITTVLQTLLNRIDLGMTLPQAVAAPRASQRNTAAVTAEQAFIDLYGSALGALGHTFSVAGAPGSSASEIGAVTAIEFGRRGKVTAVAEPTRRGGGSAMVVSKRR